jgi:hypothetical protein
VLWLLQQEYTSRIRNRTLIEQLIGMRLYSETHNSNICQTPLIGPKEEFYCKPRGTFLIKSTQIKWSQNSQAGGWTSKEVAKNALKEKLTQGDHQAQVRSDQMG